MPYFLQVFIKMQSSQWDLLWSTLLQTAFPSFQLSLSFSLCYWPLTLMIIQHIKILTYWFSLFSIEYKIQEGRKVNLQFCNLSTRHSVGTQSSFTKWIKKKIDCQKVKCPSSTSNSTSFPLKLWNTISMDTLILNWLLVFKNNSIGKFTW